MVRGWAIVARVLLVALRGSGRANFHVRVRPHPRGEGHRAKVAGEGEVVADKGFLRPACPEKCAFLHQSDASPNTIRSP